MSPSRSLDICGAIILGSGTVMWVNAQPGIDGTLKIDGLAFLIVLGAAVLLFSAAAWLETPEDTG